VNDSELAWTSIPETLEDHMAQYINRTDEVRFDYWVEVAREVIGRLNNGELATDVLYVIHTRYFLGELLNQWDLYKFLDNEEPPQLVAGNLTIHEI